MPRQLVCNWTVPPRLFNCAPNCPQTNTDTPDWSTLLALHHWVRNCQEALHHWFRNCLSHNSGFTCNTCLIRNVNEALLRNLSLTLDITEPTVKTIAAPPKIPTLVKDVLITGQPDYHLVEQGGVCAVDNSTCYTWINISGDVETQSRKITEQTTWLKMVTPFNKSFFDLLDFD